MNYIQIQDAGDHFHQKYMHIKNNSETVTGQLKDNMKQAMGKRIQVTRCLLPLFSPAVCIEALDALKSMVTLGQPSTLQKYGPFLSGF